MPQVSITLYEQHMEHMHEASLESTGISAYQAAELS